MIMFFVEIASERGPGGQAGRELDTFKGPNGIGRNDRACIECLGRVILGDRKDSSCWARPGVDGRKTEMKRRWGIGEQQPKWVVEASSWLGQIDSNSPPILTTDASKAAKND